MEQVRRFSLSYLFLEIFWIASSLGCFTQLLRAPHELQIILLIYGTLFSSVAIGGLFGRMSIGFWFGLGLAVIVVVGVAFVAPIGFPRD